MSEGSRSRRILAIGLDGFEWTGAETLLRQGRMPRLAALLAAAARVDLDHGAAKRSGLAWEHFATGLAPARARRWSAVSFDPARYRCAQLPTQLPPFPHGRPFRTVVFDAPYFDLERAADVQGLVSWGAHDPGTPSLSRPASLGAEIARRFGPYPAEPWVYGFTWPCPERTREMGRALVEATHRRAEISAWLLGERLPEWSLGIVVVSELHSAIEALWHGVDPTHRLHAAASAEPAREALEAVYCAVDALLGRLAGAFPDCTLAAFALHGMGANSADVPAMALLPEYLYRRAFDAVLLEGAAADPVAALCAAGARSWTAHVRECWRGEPATSPVARRPAPLARLTRRLRRLAPGVAAVVAPGAIRPSTPAQPALDWMPAAWYAPYWQDMPAFALPAFYDGQIRLNVLGREGHGQIAPADYDAACDALEAELRAAVDPHNGEGVIAEFVRTHPGDPMAVGATEADLVIVWRGSPLALSTARCGLLGPFAPRRPGGHTGGLGLSLWVGDDIRPGTYPARSSFDVVPTLLDYLTGGCPSEVDGASFAGLIRGSGAPVR